jgi:hypothetical protein
VAELIAPMRQGSVLYHGCEVNVLWEKIQRLSPTEVSRQSALANRQIASAAARFLSETDFSKVALPPCPLPPSLRRPSLSHLCLWLTLCLSPRSWYSASFWGRHRYINVCACLSTLVPHLCIYIVCEDPCACVLYIPECLCTQSVFARHTHLCLTQ